LPPAKGVAFAGYILPVIRGDFGGHQLRFRAQKARLLPATPQQLRPWPREFRTRCDE